MTTPLPPAAPWLVIIDMQTIFSVKGKWWGCPHFNHIIPPIQRLAKKFGDRTLVTRFVADQNPQGSWVPYYQTFPWALVPPTDPLYDLVPQIQIFARGDNIVTMTTFSKWGDAVRGVRAKTGAYPHLVLTGVATDCCVLSTATAAAEAGAFVTIVTDACAGSTDCNQEAAIDIFKGYAPLIQLTTSEALLNG